MKKIAVAILLLAGLMAGCSKLPDQGAPSPPVPTPTVVVGDTPRHIDPAGCDQASRRVIDQEKLTNISGCAMEMVKLADGTSASYVVINYGPGMDCPSGCIYERKVAIVLPDRVAILPEPFLGPREIHAGLNTKLKVSLPDSFLKESDRHFVEKDGQWQMVLTFRRYLDGKVIVHPTNHWEKGLEVVATPDGLLTAEQVQPRIWPEYVRQCQPPAGAKSIVDVSPRNDGGWNATLVWDLGNQYRKVAGVVDASGAVTFPQGCGK